MSIRTKLIMMLAIPLAALALVGALGFRGQSSAANAASDALAADGVVQGINQAIKAVGAERLAVVAEAPAEELDELRAATDAQLADAADLAGDQRLPGVEAAVTNASNLLLGARSNGSMLDAVVGMNDATEELRAIRGRIEVSYPSPDSFAEATSIDLAVDIADRQDAIWLEYIASDSIDDDLADRLAAEVVATELLREQILDIAPESHIAPLNASMASAADGDIERAAISALDLHQRGEGLLDDASTLDAVVASHQDWYGHAVMLQDDVSANLAARSTDAESRQNLFALLGTLGLLVLFGLIYVVYRSVVRPLNDLLDGAEQVANDRLPSVVSELRAIGSSDANVSLSPLPRQTDDELGSLVDAFNDVQLTAFDLAVEQARSRRNIAEMFVNLGRRNQKILQRMLNVLSDLEHDEKDGDKLERLFELDHMTTRMRRNAESLLVVAGTKTPRQWAKPVPAADVVRSALAEVQEYQRVDVLELADAPMAGNAVTDVTHLLAELLENSLQFSEPESRVTVSSRWSDDGYRIIVADQGFGMSDDELADHNNLIANPPPPDQAPTRFLGLFVVGHLADRHGIRVVLSDGTVAGTDARITIPHSIMSDAGDPTASRAIIDVADSGLDAHLGADIDFDAELSKLTAEANAQNGGESLIEELPVRGQSPVNEDTGSELPTRGEIAAEPTESAEAVEAVETDEAAAGAFGEHVDAAPEAPVNGVAPVADVVEPIAAAPVAEEVAEEVAEAAEVEPVDHADSLWIDPSEMVIPEPTPAPRADAPAEPAPFTAATVPTPVAPNGEAAIDFSQLPERPVFSAAAAPAPAAPAPSAPAPATPAPMPQAAAPAPAPQAPIAAPAPAAPAEPALNDMGLPVRRPQAALEELGGVASEAPQAPAADAFSAAAAPAEPTMPTENTNSVASRSSAQFSAFQAGAKRSDNDRS